jgi:hypothetical protein
MSIFTTDLAIWCATPCHLVLLLAAAVAFTVFRKHRWCFAGMVIAVPLSLYGVATLVFAFVFMNSMASHGGW